MAFNQLVKKAYAGGALTAFIAPLASYKGSQIALNTKVAGTITSTAGLVLSMANTFMNVEWDSLAAIVETDLTTSTITLKSMWQVSNDGTNWIQFFGNDCTALSAVAAAGTGALVTTQYVHAWPGVNPSFPYVRLAVQNGVVTGGAGDNVTVAYNWRMRWAAA